MLAVIADFGFLDKLNIAPEHHFFGKAVKPRQAKHRRIIARIHHAAFAEAVILTMLGDDGIEHAGIFQRTKHHGRILHTLAVVGVADSAGAVHQTHFGKLDAFAFFCNRAHHIDVRLSGLPAHSMDVFDAGGILNRRVGIGHTDDRGKTARDGRRRTAGDGLFFLIARLAEMNVNIDQPRRYIFAGGVNDVLCGFADLADLCDLAVGDQHIAFGVDAVGRVDYVSVFY